MKANHGFARDMEFLGWLLGGSVGIGTLFSTFVAGIIMHLIYSTIGFEPRKLRHSSVKETVKLLKGR